MTDETNSGAPFDAPGFAAEALQKLGSAGSEGLAASQLLARQAAKKAGQLRVLSELQAAGQVAGLLKGKVMRYWLPGCLPSQATPEEKADEILRRILGEQRGCQLHTFNTIKTELLAGQGIPDDAIRTCVRLMEREKLLLAFTLSGKTYYAYAPAVRAHLEGSPTPAPVAETSPVCAVPDPPEPPPFPDPEPEPATPPQAAHVIVEAPPVPQPLPEPPPIEAIEERPLPAIPPPVAPESPTQDTPALAPEPQTGQHVSEEPLPINPPPPVETPPPTQDSAPSSPVAPPLTNQRVIEAYQIARQNRRIPDVEISRLREVLHCTVDELKPAVRRLCEAGIFIPGKGDWSFATAANRAAAVLIHNEPHLFVRMKDGAAAS